MRERIALFGGSFDPFHVGHYLVAQTVWETFQQKEIVFLPCAQSPLKKVRPVASDGVRLQCLRHGLRGLRWAKVSDWEMSFSGPSYSIDTARHWKENHPYADLDWILGSDQWSQIRSWRGYRELGKLVRFLVFPRPNVPKPVSGLSMTPVPLRFDLSASEIRARLKKGRPIHGMVLPEVEKIICKTRSYR